MRGIVATDALIGTFAAMDDPGLRQNRCFLYHVIGNGTGRWDVPVGGMGALTAALETAARGAGADLRAGSRVAAIRADGETAVVTTADGAAHPARHVLAGVAPVGPGEADRRSPARPSPGGLAAEAQPAPQSPSAAARSRGHARGGVCRHLPCQRGLRAASARLHAKRPPVGFPTCRRARPTAIR